MRKPYAFKFGRTLTSVLLCGTAIHAQAFITPTESRYESGGVRYYFVVSGWTENNMSGSPCSQIDSRFTNCYFSIRAMKRYQWLGTVGSYYEWKVPARSGSRMYELLSDLKAQGFRMPFYGSILVPRESASKDLCITFIYSQNGPTVGGSLSTFGSCYPVVTPALQCEIEGDTTIDHRNLPDNALNGAKASTQLDLQCRGAASVTVSVSRTNSSGVQLRSDDSLYSKVTLNGKDATAGINVKVADGRTTKLDITSTLITRGTVTPGPFSGSTVVTVSPP